ncbi:MBL fold metallo-hydrolase [Dysgonomonas sp. 216]|uniref:MBL fold metallo-hydrolase n=1 Tax=Dysgonomonas sp. 216 TaxID=2302934 RepID=UPI0013D8A369|nr:MBL fold metallo-hydrolase [Dysgonomonas sp. 216]NDW17521.1 MBL fold metallo-hydrolase [Dysgonomonas sp. 216]
MIVKTFQFNPIYVNTYVVYDETNECVIIDASCFYPDERETLLNFILDKKLIVKHLLNTHLHFDHVFGNTFVYEQFNLKTKAHKDDLFLLEAIPAQMRMFGFDAPAEIPEIESYLNEDDIIEFGNQRFLVLHVPGHSPGSVVFYNDKEKALFAGDVLFRSSIGRTDLAGGNHDQLIDNIQKKLLTLPPETKVYSGHGPTTTIGEEIRNNPYL